MVNEEAKAKEKNRFIVILKEAAIFKIDADADADAR